jgi:uncharacterized membrane protein YgcG
MQVDDIVNLQKQDVKVVKCEKCNRLMVNIDANKIEAGDMQILKRLGVHISNPETPDPICVNCEVEVKPTFREKIKRYFDSDDDNDSHLSSGGSWGGSSSDGGFGGFGGGSFSGGGASRGF